MRGRNNARQWAPVYKKSAQVEGQARPQIHDALELELEVSGEACIGCKHHALQL